jgi:hypothetical protein
MRSKRALAAAAAVASIVTLSAHPADAAINDDFRASTSNGCGRVNFVDNGPGVPGNGESNDDYLVVHDYCGDHHGVRAWAWVKPRGFSDYTSLGSRYNGNGEAGAPVYWDPFKDLDPNHGLLGGDTVAIQVCLVDGSNGSPRPGCSKVTYHTMQDG